MGRPRKTLRELVESGSYRPGRYAELSPALKQAYELQKKCLKLLRQLRKLDPESEEFAAIERELLQVAEGEPLPTSGKS